MTLKGAIATNGRPPTIQRHLDVRAGLRHRVAFRRLRLSISRDATTQQVMEMICDNLQFGDDSWVLPMDIHEDDHQVPSVLHLTAKLNTKRATALARLRDCLRADEQTVRNQPVTTPSHAILWILERVAQRTEEFSC